MMEVVCHAAMRRLKRAVQVVVGGGVTERVKIDLVAECEHADDADDLVAEAAEQGSRHRVSIGLARGGIGSA